MLIKATIVGVYRSFEGISTMDIVRFSAKDRFARNGIVVVPMGFWWCSFFVLASLLIPVSLPFCSTLTPRTLPISSPSPSYQNRLRSGLDDGRDSLLEDLSPGALRRQQVVHSIP